MKSFEKLTPKASFNGRKFIKIDIFQIDDKFLKIILMY